jgi:hypothetical protein
MSVLHDDFIYEMPVVIGMKITPSDSLTQAYVDHIDNLFRKERATQGFDLSQGLYSGLGNPYYPRPGCKDGARR